MSSIVKCLFLACILLSVDKKSASAIEFTHQVHPRNNAILSPGVVFRDDNEPRNNISQPIIVTFSPSNPSPALASSRPSPRVRFLDELLPSPQTQSSVLPDTLYVQGSTQSTGEQNSKSHAVQSNSGRNSDKHIPGSQLTNRPNVPDATDSKLRSVFGINVNGTVEKQLGLAATGETPYGRQQTQVIDAKNEASSIVESIYANDRWSWPRQDLPSTSRAHHAGGSTIPPPQAKQLVSTESNNAINFGTTTPSLPKVFSKLSRCPKLFADVDLLCTITPSNYPVVLSWKKRTFSGNNSIDQEILISHGKVNRSQDLRYSILPTDSPSNAVLRIKALKSNDCGIYKCEARDRQGTILGSSDVLVFMCL